MLAIGVTETPYAAELSKLSNVSSEIEKVCENASKHQVPVVQIQDKDATVDKTISLLKDYNIVHFSCHGQQDQNVPMNSALYLGNDRLSLSQIASLRLSDAQIAFLSACRTASGSELLTDEAIHIAAGMQVAGYRSVVATMWSMPDWIGPEIVSEFYDRLFESSDTNTSSSSSGAAAALRGAMIALRLRKDVKVSAAVWVNFICIGI
jgi:CHAT domain-containing protein